MSWHPQGSSNLHQLRLWPTLLILMNYFHSNRYKRNIRCSAQATGEHESKMLSIKKATPNLQLPSQLVCSVSTFSDFFLCYNVAVIRTHRWIIIVLCSCIKVVTMETRPGADTPQLHLAASMASSSSKTRG